MKGVVIGLALVAGGMLFSLPQFFSGALAGLGSVLLLNYIVQAASKRNSKR